MILIAINFFKRIICNLRFCMVLLLVCGIVRIEISAKPQATEVINRKKYDFVLGVDGDFKEALAAASKAASSKERFYVYFPSGEYNIGKQTGDSNQMTTLSVSNISFIGEERDNTVIYNTAKKESISTTATLYFLNSDNVYMQDLTVANRATYDPEAPASRFVAVRENGDKFIYKNVKLLSNQDTYYSNGKRAYWEDGEIHGTFDFICGEGDIFFNRCLLYVKKNSPVVIAAPATQSSWGYVFMNCTIDGTADDGYFLGRPWKNQPKCVYINTVMEKQPLTEGWIGLFANSTFFAEYNSMSASGDQVDLSVRRATQVKDGKTVEINPVLSSSEADDYTVENVLSGNDNWQPDDYTRQLSAPVVTYDGKRIQWSDDENALCWVIFKDKKYYTCVTSNSFDISSDSKSNCTVRAANSMGGLGPVSNVIQPAAVHNTIRTPIVKGTDTRLHYNRSQKIVRVYTDVSKELTIRIFSLNGKELLSKRYACSDRVGMVEMPLKELRAGFVFLRLEYGGKVQTVYLNLMPSYNIEQRRDK